MRNISPIPQSQQRSFSEPKIKDISRNLQNINTSVERTRHTFSSVDSYSLAGPRYISRRFVWQISCVQDCQTKVDVGLKHVCIVKLRLRLFLRLYLALSLCLITHPSKLFSWNGTRLPGVNSRRCERELNSTFVLRMLPTKGSVKKKEKKLGNFPYLW